MRVLWVVWVLMFGMGVSLAGDEPPLDQPAVHVFSSDERFEDVVENIKMAIIERGMLVSGTLHVSDMLNRTAADLGFSEVFEKAESVEFCSALISHKMAQVTAENIVICPFTIAVYIKQEEPGQVHVAYRHPLLAGEADEVTGAILEMLEGIVQDAI